ncbi:MAG: hypothetical protein JW384_03652 [Nitrosomonadaceae bacterium]|nr:hypothetical protein [Nitrosomonadaceae bacterium]
MTDPTIASWSRESDLLFQLRQLREENERLKKEIANQRPWVDLTDEDWEWVADKKETSLDTFAHGAAWAADQLKERNT